MVDAIKQTKRINIYRHSLVYYKYFLKFFLMRHPKFINYIVQKCSCNLKRYIQPISLSQRG